MMERTFSHIILTITTGLGFCWLFNEPYGFTSDRLLGVFIILFMSWAAKTNFESALKEEGVGNG